MRAPTEKDIPELLYSKRFSQIFTILSLLGLSTGWLYSSALWLLCLITCFFWIVSASGLLWLARNPGTNALDFYKTPYWWLKMLDFEFKKEPKE